jgi:hypothetical protein
MLLYLIDFAQPFFNQGGETDEKATCGVAN